MGLLAGGSIGWRPFEGPALLFGAFGEGGRGGQTFTLEGANLGAGTGLVVTGLVVTGGRGAAGKRRKRYIYIHNNYT